MNKGNLKGKQMKTEVKWRDSTCDSNDDKMVTTHIHNSECMWI